MAQSAVPEQVRAAQRRIVGTVNACGVLTRDGLAMWREAGCGERKATAGEIARDLVLLEVPNQVVKAFRFPLAADRSGLMRRGEEIRVARGDLTHLVRWMPALRESIDQLAEDAPGFGFAIVEPRGEHVAVLQLALAADWPYWTAKQAEKAGLMCAECGFDLPARRRLVCGTCCNEGLDAPEQAASLAQ